MDPFSEKLNRLLVDTFRVIQKAEEEMASKLGPSRLSVNELHLLEAIWNRQKEGCTISDLAQDIGITLPSITVAINKLQKKGFAEKSRSESDRRVVYVSLTRSGERMNTAHRYFHREMISRVCKELTEEEKNSLSVAIERLNAFFMAQQ